MPIAGIVLAVLGGLLFILILWFVLAYNGLVSARNQTKNAWSQIDVQLKRRHDLIPNLVETAKGYVAHERGTLENVIKARNMAMQAHGAAEAGKAEQSLTNALGQFFVVVEQYPNLKANENFLKLQEELASTENRIGFARQYYNDQATAYKTSLQSVPTNIVAGMFGFAPLELFELTVAGEREVPKVQF